MAARKDENSLYYLLVGQETNVNTGIARLLLAVIAFIAVFGFFCGRSGPSGNGAFCRSTSFVSRPDIAFIPFFGKFAAPALPM